MEEGEQLYFQNHALQIRSDKLMHVTHRDKRVVRDSIRLCNQPEDKLNNPDAGKDKGIKTEA